MAIELQKIKSFKRLHFAMSFTFEYDVEGNKNKPLLTGSSQHTCIAKQMCCLTRMCNEQDVGNLFPQCVTLKARSMIALLEISNNK